MSIIQLKWSASPYGPSNPAKSYILCDNAVFRRGAERRPTPADLYSVHSIPIFNAGSVFLEYEITGNSTKHGALLRVVDTCAEYGSRPQIGFILKASTRRTFLTEMYFSIPRREARRLAKEAAQRHLDQFMKQLFPELAEELKL